jgi:hypothetical protein
MTSFDLRSYLCRFPEVHEPKFGRRLDLAKLEKEFESLPTGRRRLTGRDVAKNFERGRIPFVHYWQQPETKVVERELAKRPILISYSFCAGSPCRAAPHFYDLLRRVNFPP